MKSFWNNRYRNHGKLYGDDSSNFVKMINVDSLRNTEMIFLGCGYGRDIKYLLAKNRGITVTAIDFSLEGLLLSEIQNDSVTFLNSDYLDLSLAHLSHSNVLAHYFIHLFMKNARSKILRKAYEELSKTGELHFSCISNEDEMFGKGEEIEESTFKCYQDAERKDFFLHFYSVDEISRECKKAGFNVEKIVPYEESELILGKIKKTRSFYVNAKKS